MGRRRKHQPQRISELCRTDWIDISWVISKGGYRPLVHQAMTDIVDYLKTDLGFSKLLYKYLLMNDQISGQDLCLVLYEQGVLSKYCDEFGPGFASGELNSMILAITKSPTWRLSLHSLH